MSIDVSQFRDEIIASLQNVAKEARDEFETVADDVSREAVADLKANSPKSERNGKHYAKGWKAKKTKTKFGDVKITVYNSTKPTLTHLLENGYISRSGRKVKGKEHIKPVRDDIERKLKERL